MKKINYSNRFAQAQKTQMTGKRAVIIAAAMMILSLFSTQITAQCTLQCVPDVEVSLFNRNDLIIQPELVVINPFSSCPGGVFDIRIYDKNDNYLGDFVNYTMIDSVLKMEVEITNHGLACSVDLTVVDEIVPMISCDTKYMACADSILPKHIGFPTVTDNIWMMDSSHLSYADVRVEFPCFTMVGDSSVTNKIERTWLAQDSSGNVGTCTQDIYFLRRSLENVSFPENRDGFAQPVLVCRSDNPDDLKLTGAPTVAGGSLNDFNNCSLAITYTDDEQTVCGGEKRILRHWKVTDWCLDSSLTKVQVIRIKDLQAPILAVADTLEVDMNDYQCTASVVLPNATVTDSCSQTNTVIRWKYGIGNGPYFNVPQGFHEVTYTATDDCGNAATKSMIVSIWDKELPTPVCDPQKELSLSSTGNTTVPSSTFDDGSRDNCGIDRVECSRDGMPFSEFIVFDCDDLGLSIAVNVKIIDNNGLENNCDVNVKIVDRIKPEITCPASMTIACTDNLYNLPETGTPTSTDNCGIDTTTYSDNLQLNACGIGLVERHWTTEDLNGNRKSCIQQITVQDETPIQIVFPNDYITNICNANTIPDITGRPVITGDDCENLEVKYSDEIFGAGAPACFKIKRTWTIVDFCVDANTGNGTWEEIQNIEIIDEIAPVFDDYDDVVFGAGNNSCQARVEMADLTAIDCSVNLTINNDSPFADANGANASGDYPAGNHAVTFTASDGCGNTSQKVVMIRVQDDKPPTPVCNRGIALSLNSDGMIDINPNIIAAAIWDNCSVQADMQIALEPAVFTCANLGETEVTLYATDEAGNEGFCTTIVEVQDNLQVCDFDEPIATIAGEIKTMSGEPAVQVLMGLSGGIQRGLQTNPDGSYYFERLPKDLDYTVTPTYDVDYVEGVSTLDIIKISRHILNVELFDSPYKWVAADADRSNTVSTLDIIILRKLILRTEDNIATNTSWRFIDKKHIFPQTGSPLSRPIPEAVSINNLAWNHLNTDFVAVKVGDLDGDARLNNIASVDDRTDGEAVIFNVKNQKIKKGETIEIPFKTSNTNALIGFQFTLEFDERAMAWGGFAGKEVIDISTNHTGQAHLDRGMLTFSWDTKSEVSFPKTATLFNLVFTAKKDVLLSEVLNLTSNLTKAEAYRKDSQSLYEKRTIVLEFDDEKSEQPITTISTEPITNFPNPFLDVTTLTFNLPAAANVRLKLFDSLGKEFIELERFFEKGQNNWSLDAANFDHRYGIILYQIEADGLDATTGKMIRMKH